MSSSIKYAKISIKKRERLVQLVLVKGFSINRARKQVNIKSSTAKLIVKRYRENGTFSTRNQGTRSPIDDQNIAASRNEPDASPDQDLVQEVPNQDLRSEFPLWIPTDPWIADQRIMWQWPSTFWDRNWVWF